MPDTFDVRGLSYWKAILTVVILIMTAIGLILGGGGVVATKLWGLTPIERHQSDIIRIERKLDCILFNFPRNCRQRLRPVDPYDIRPPSSEPRP